MIYSVPTVKKSGFFLTKFSLKNLVVKFVVSNFAAYSMIYTFTGSLASDNPFWGASEIP